jgi:chaperone BCS1
LIHAIAGELALDIYVVSLSSSWINDATLTALMGRVPAVSASPHLFICVESLT